MPLDILKKYFGYDSFRPAQAEIIDSIMSGKPTLGILPTGGGKSLCYQVPALMMEGLTIVISPLISLMKDQVDSLKQNGIAAEYFNSSQDSGEQSRVLQALQSGGIRLLYVAPERIQSAPFMSALARVRVSMVAVDEAHCISQWGHDFRPSYQAIPQMLKAIPSRPLLTAFTATATPEVRADILQKLHISGASVFVQGFDRPNLTLSVYTDVDKMEYLQQYIRDHKGQSGIIYANTRKSVEEIQARLKKAGVRAGAYHAGMADEARKQTQEDFIYERLDIIVATNAFGMGIDKSNVRYVIHNNMPRDLESYYQEAGRAGRDGEPAECILLFQGNDVALQRYFLDMSREQLPPAMMKKREEKLQEMVNYCHSQDCLRSIILTYFGERMQGAKCGNCSNCRDFEWEDVTKDSAIILACAVQISAGAATLAEILSGSRNQKILRNGWDTLSGHGLMKDRRKEDIRRLINNLISQQDLRVSGGQYPVLELTAKGRSRLKSGQPIQMKRFAHQEQRRGPREEQVAQGLFERLRHLRMTLSRTEKVPPYVIFSDHSLQEMARHTPRSKGELLAIDGVGEKKMQQYGEVFLAVIQEYCVQNGITPGRPAPAPRRKKTPEGLSDKILEYHSKHRAGMSTDAIAGAMGVQPSTVISNLLRCAGHGHELDYSRLIPGGQEGPVLQAIKSKGYNLLKPIKEALPDYVSYDTIRLVIQKHFAK